MKNICVFASSSTRLDKKYYDAATDLGRRIAEKGYGIVFGGGTEGLMGALARGAEELHGAIIGVIPDMMNAKGVVFERCTELIATRTLRERKAIMEQRSDAFIALPGGFGTLEELLEIITLRQLGIHQKNIALLNMDGYFSPLLAQLKNAVDERFADGEALKLFGVFDTTAEALEYLENAKPVMYIKNNKMKNPADRI